MKKMIFVFLVIIALLFLQLERQNIKIANFKNENERLTSELQNVDVAENESLEDKTLQNRLISLDEKIYSNMYSVYGDEIELDKKSSANLSNSYTVNGRASWYKRYSDLWEIEKKNYISKISEKLSNDRLKNAFSDSNDIFSEMVVRETERVENIIIKEENLDDEEINYTKNYIDYTYNRSRALILKDTYEKLLEFESDKNRIGDTYEIDILLEEQLSYEYTTMGIAVTFIKYADLWQEEVNDNVASISGILKNENERTLFLKSQEKWQKYIDSEISLENEIDGIIVGSGSSLQYIMASNKYNAYKNRSIELKEMYVDILDKNGYNENIENINIYENDINSKLETDEQKNMLITTMSNFDDYVIAQNEFIKMLNSDNNSNIYYKMYKIRANDLLTMYKSFSEN